MSPAVAAVTAKNQLLNSFDVIKSIRAKENEISQMKDNPTGGANEVYIFSLVATRVLLNLRSSYFPIRSLRELQFVSEMQCPIAKPPFEDFISQVSNSTDYINEASSWLCNSGKKHWEVSREKDQQEVNHQGHHSPSSSDKLLRKFPTDRNSI